MSAVAGKVPFAAQGRSSTVAGGSRPIRLCFLTRRRLGNDPGGGGIALPADQEDAGNARPAAFPECERDHRCCKPLLHLQGRCRPDVPAGGQRPFIRTMSDVDGAHDPAPATTGQRKAEPGAGRSLRPFAPDPAGEA